MLELNLFGQSAPPPAPDNTDPHPVVIEVHPREWVVPFAHQYEAEYEFDVSCPSTCSGYVEECPVADYLDVIGVDENINAGFPEPDFLSDGDLAVLDGTVRSVTITRSYSRSSGPYGEDWDVEYEFVWSDE